MATLKEKLFYNWRRRLILAGLIVAGLAVGVGGTLLIQHARSDDLEQKYNLLSKRILLEQPNDILLNFRDLQTEYEEYLAANGLQDKVNLYFEYLPTGSSIGINENREATGASLLKLPLAMSFYKLAEEGKTSLDKKVALKQKWLNNSFGDLYKKGAGYELTYRQAISYALQDSDNTAALMLFDAVSEAQHTSSPGILSFVDANYANTPSQDVTITVQSYSSILKCLYFSCYLSKDGSQAILNELIHAKATDRLQLFLPDNVRVAHKIGTFQGFNQSDCGIVYVPQRNYAICIMVQEEDPAASRVIGDLSQMTYKYLAPDTEDTIDQ